MKISKDAYGKTHGGEAVDAYTLSGGKVTLRLMTYGGTWLSLTAPDREGQLSDIALGASDLEGYQNPNNPYLGALIGRCGNRIGNSKFELNGKQYAVTPNKHPHHLHGGTVGFDKKLWKASVVKHGGKEKLMLSLISSDGEEGYPGCLEVKVYHYITDDGAIELEYNAIGDADTLCNLTQHNYFNLDGHAGGHILNHELTVNADYVTDVDAALIPNGKVIKVAGTAFDFNKSKAIGRDIAENILAQAKGYDVNYVITRKGGGLQKVAEVYSPKSGRCMEVWTTKPSVQLYTGNYFNNLSGKDGAVYNQYAGFALETQYAPDSINHKNAFGYDADIVLKKGKTYKHITIYKLKT